MNSKQYITEGVEDSMVYKELPKKLKKVHWYLVFLIKQKIELS
jgi:hypothetical protein